MARESTNIFIKIINWFNEDKARIVLALILVFGFCIRLYYFSMTSGQALWWDEAEYMANAKKWAFGVPYDLNPQRPPLFQALSALVFAVGLGEVFIRFAFVLLPSVFLVLAIYLLGKEMFDKKIGLIASFLASISWTFLFWTSRVQPDSFSMSFQVLSILFMWKYWKQGKNLFSILAGIFAGLGFYFKVSSLLVPIVFMVFIFLKDGFKGFKTKAYYLFALAFILTLVPYFIWSYSEFGGMLAFRAGYSNQVVAPTMGFGWYNLNFYYSLTEDLLFLLFIGGLLISLKFFLYLDLIAKERNRVLNEDIFSVIVLVVVSAFYIFYIRGTEDRWVFLWMPFIFFMAGKSLVSVYSMIGKKSIAILLIFGMLVFIGYSQISHADNLIKLKKDSYLPVKSAGIWIKENSQKEDKVLSISLTQSAYYSERNMSTYSGIKSGEEFDKYIAENKPRFLQVSIFEPHPEWIYAWTQNNQEKIKPVQAYFSDATKKQAVLVVYEIIK